MTTIAVTGAAGYLGRLCCEALDDRAVASRVLAIDDSDIAFATRNLEFYRTTSPDDVAALLADCDAVVAARADPSVLQAVAGAGVRRVVAVSSALAYGAHPDNPAVLDETATLRPDDAHEHLAAFEAAAGVLSESARVTVLRPALVCGPSMSGQVRRMFEAPVAFAGDRDPQVQAVHESDFVRAVRFVIERDLTGVHNVGSPQTLALSEAMAIARSNGAVVHASGDRDRLRQVASTARRLGVGDVDGAAAAFRLYTCVLDTTKLATAGFAYRYGTRDAIRDATESAAPWTSVAGVRFRPRRVAAVLGVAAVAALGLMRRSGSSQAHDGL